MNPESGMEYVVQDGTDEIRVKLWSADDGRIEEFPLHSPFFYQKRIVLSKKKRPGDTIRIIGKIVCEMNDSGKEKILNVFHMRHVNDPDEILLHEREIKEAGLWIGNTLSCESLRNEITPMSTSPANSFTEASANFHPGPSSTSATSVSTISLRNCGNVKFKN